VLTGSVWARILIPPIVRNSARPVHGVSVVGTDAPSLYVGVCELGILQDSAPGSPSRLVVLPL